MWVVVSNPPSMQFFKTQLSKYSTIACEADFCIPDSLRSDQFPLSFYKLISVTYMYTLQYRINIYGRRERERFK